MDKKKIIIIVAVVVIVLYLYFSSKGKSVEELVESISNMDSGKDAAKAGDAVVAVTQNDADNAYNQARENYRKLSGEYPPATWTQQQIQIWIDEWAQMKDYLSKYSSIMSSMQKANVAAANVSACSSLADAKVLYQGAVSEYEVYKQKLSIYNELVSICKQYSIDASDLGISSVNAASVAQLNNAMTKAKSLGQVKSLYNELDSLCRNAGVQISDYIGNGKWYNVTQATYSSAITTVTTLYHKQADAQAVTVARDVWRNLNPYRYGQDGNINLMSFRDRPYEAKWALAPAVFQNAIDFCAKSAYHRTAFNAAFKAEHKDYPVFRCQQRGDWPYFDTLADLMRTCIAHSGGSTHLTGRDNWGAVEKLYNQKKAPLV